MKILIKNATLVAMDETKPQVQEKMDILIVDNRIEKISTNIEENVDKIINANNNVVMPGLINLHSHVGMSIFRETVDGLSLQNWLENAIWPIEDKLTEDDIYRASKLSFMEMIETGTTTVNDMYFFARDEARAAKELGVRAQVTRTLMDSISKEDGEARFEEIRDLIKEFRNDELISINAGLHGLYTSSKDYATEAFKFAKENNLNLHMHFCENTKEREDIFDSYDEEPEEFLHDVSDSVNVILAHCVKTDPTKLPKDVSIASCPVSNMRLGCGIPKIKKMLELGINVGLGTDGQGSGSSLDMFEQMKITPLLQKGIEEDPTLIPAYEVLKMATINGAKALKMDNKIGSIEEGKLADILIVDMKNTLTIPVNNVVSELVYNVKGKDVLTTIINGKIVMEDRELKTGKKCDIIASV